MSAVDKPVVLYVDDEAGNLAAFNAAFRRDFNVRLAQSADKALEALDQEQVDVMITDQRMPTTTGINLVRATKASHPEVVKMILKVPLAKPKVSQVIRKRSSSFCWERSPLVSLHQNKRL